MSQAKTFKDSDNSIIKPGREQGEPLLGRDAIMVAMPSELAFMKDLCRAERVTLKRLSPFKLFVVQGDTDPPLALAGPLLGAPHGVIVMEKLIALGAKRIWYLGWCGSLQSDLSVGDLIIPTASFSEEGTSAHYPVNKRQRKTSSLLNKKLEHGLALAGIPFRKGPIWTTDALYRETGEKVKAYGKRGALAVEMEMSALITVALYRSVDLAGLLVVSDELSSLAWHNGFGQSALKKRSREAGRLLLNVCMNGKGREQ